MSDAVKKVLIDEIISAYHTTRLRDMPAADHILRKPHVQQAFDALNSVVAQATATTPSPEGLQEPALKEALDSLETRDVHVGYDHGGNYIYEDYVSLADVRRALSTLPQQAATDEREAADWAREWHRCVETILTMAGLSPALGASEAALAMQEYITRVEATPPSPASDTMLREAIPSWFKVALQASAESGNVLILNQTDAKDVLATLTQPEPTAQQAAGEAEAVAWMYRNRRGEVRFTEDNMSASTSAIALYATPQPTETQRIVAWLRKRQHPFKRVMSLFHALANAIEAGEHLAGEGQ